MTIVFVFTLKNSFSRAPLSLYALYTCISAWNDWKSISR